MVQSFVTELDSDIDLKGPNGIVHRDAVSTTVGRTSRIWNVLI
jgi:hypothetical protein